MATFQTLKVDYIETKKTGLKALCSSAEHTNYCHVIKTHGIQGQYISDQDPSMHYGNVHSLWVAFRGYFGLLLCQYVDLQTPAESAAAA